MRSAWYSKNGAAREVLKVGELPTPMPAPGEVRVKLATSGVNPSDVKSRLGRPLGTERIVPHSDGAGVIDMVGDGVSSSRIGERVWIWNGQWQRPMGTAAEYIALPEAQAVRLPVTTDFAAAACLGIPAMTACQAIHLLGDISGKTVLVIGASSAVGHYAAQLAVIGGAEVIGTVGSAEKACTGRRRQNDDQLQDRACRAAGEGAHSRARSGRHRRHGFLVHHTVAARRCARASWHSRWLWLECVWRHTGSVSHLAVQLDQFAILSGL